MSTFGTVAYTNTGSSDIGLFFNAGSAFVGPFFDSSILLDTPSFVQSTNGFMIYGAKADANNGPLAVKNTSGLNYATGDGTLSFRVIYQIYTIL